MQKDYAMIILFEAGDLMSDSSGILFYSLLLYLSFFSMKNTFLCRIPRSILF